MSVSPWRAMTSGSAMGSCLVGEEGGGAPKAGSLA